MSIVKLISVADGNVKKTCPREGGESVQQGPLAYYVLEGVSFVLARSPAGPNGFVHPRRVTHLCVTHGAYSGYVSTAKWQPACAKPLRQRQGTPLAAFFNIPM